MEWRSIPGFEAYEISNTGIVRNRATKYRLSHVGRRYELWDGKGRQRMLPGELVDMAFGQPAEPAAAPAPDPVPDAGELARLRARIAELEDEVAGLRALPKLLAPKPAPTATAKPKKPSPAKTDQKKRHCVVCGCELPPGYWRRCRMHAFREDNYHTEDDFSGSVAL